MRSKGLPTALAVACCCMFSSAARSDQGIRAPAVAATATPVLGTISIAKMDDEDPAELYRRGLAAEEGSGTPKDEKQAAGLYRISARHGYVPAEYELGLLLEQGRGVAQDFRSAAQWYQSAADQGCAEAQNNLGLYARGQGVLQDDRQAVLWYTRAAKQNNAEAQTNLAECYRVGRGVQQDLKRAFELNQLAAKSGYPVAENNLGLMYANGAGTERNNCLAYAWISVAARSLPASRSLVKQLENRMSSEERLKAQQITQEIESQLASGVAAGEFK